MLDQQLGDVNVKLVTTRRRMGGINSAKEQNVAIVKQIKILENRMEKAYIKFNEAITHNKQLREQIDNMRRERMMFENIDNSLERELVRLKREMADIIEQSTVAHEARERALSEMAHLKQQADREQQGFEDEWKALTSIIEEDRRARVPAHSLLAYRLLHMYTSYMPDCFAPVAMGARPFLLGRLLHM